MTPMPVNPKIVVLIDSFGKPVMVASNIAPLPELEVKVTKDMAEFHDEALGKTFVGLVNPGPQILS